MKKILFISLLLLSSFSLFASPARLIPLNPGTGSKLLIESHYQDSYWKLANYFECQEDPNYCGVASSVIVLNALGIPKPKIARLDNSRIFTQRDSFFTQDVQKIITPQRVHERGIQLDELVKILRTFHVKATPLKADSMTLDQFRDTLKKTLNDPNSFIIGDYYRGIVGQGGAGHFSPIAAYNEKSDRLLLMDVARYSNKPVWIKTEVFYKSMKFMEKGKTTPRGCIIVSKPANMANNSAAATA